MDGLSTGVSPAAAAWGARDAAPLRGAAGPSFARGLWRIAAAAASSGNRVALLRDGPALFAATLGAIDGARSEVMLESYIVRGDAVGRRFADALVAAAARGVRVRVLHDWIGSRQTPRGFWHRLRRGGVHVRAFGRPGLRAWLGILPRDHRKLTVVDGVLGFTGGIGIGDEWAEAGDSRSSWRDTAVRIEGPAAADMARAFELMWRRATGEERRGSARFLVRSAVGSGLSLESAPGAVVGLIEGEPWHLRAARAFQIQAVSAERSMWIANAYFVPSIAEHEALAGAARDGVDVRILVPSTSDHPWVRALTRRSYRQLLRNGVRIWEWQGPMMHAKVSVVDSRWVSVGSTDFNLLGTAVNYELDAVIEDHALGLAAEEMFNADFAQSEEIRL